ncbi:MAG: DNA methyltransferase [Dehalococcoidia bacterium]
MAQRSGVCARYPMEAMDTNVIYCGDNLEVLPKYVRENSVDLIYIDPPFNTSRNYEVFWGEAQERRAFEDRFGDAMAYLEWMRPRARELYKVLKPTGSFYYHCDWHVSHYIKVELDRIFGADNFVNEIVWQRTNARSTSGRWPRIHDVLLFYRKSNKVTFHSLKVKANKARMPHTLITGADGLKYQTYELTAPGTTAEGESGKPWRGFDASRMGRHWANTHAIMDDWDVKGLIHWPKNEGFPRRRADTAFDPEERSVTVGDVWTDIDRINQSAKERLGYPTQKPVTLMERIIGASSNEGDIVLDAFCGCGTTLEAAAKLRRKWIGVDLSPTACRVMGERLEGIGLAEGRDFEIRDMPKSEEDLRRMPHFEFQNWACIALGGIPNRVKSNDYGIDGRVYPADLEKRADKPARAGQADLFRELDKWYPIQVKQKDKAGRPDIDSFETAMMRDRRTRGYFVAFGFSKDADAEIKRAGREHGLEIVPVTVGELLEFERKVGA